MIAVQNSRQNNLHKKKFQSYKRVFNAPSYPVIWITFLIWGLLLMPFQINPAFSSEDSIFGFHPALIAEDGYSDNGLDDAENIGIKWTRQATPAYWGVIQPDLEVDEYDFSFHDQQWGVIPEGMFILGDISPGTLVEEGSWIPVDKEKYYDFVKATVERYDGDGIDDLYLLESPIKYWQVGNEFSKRADFHELQKMSYQAIKEACSDCKVLLGGIASLPGNSYSSRFEESYASTIRALNGQYVDIFDLHWYGEADGEYLMEDKATGLDIVTYFRLILSESGFPKDVPIWSTEMGTYSDQPDDLPFQSQFQQASDNFKRYIYGAYLGFEKIFHAYGLMEGWDDEGSLQDHSGLIYEGKNPDDQGLGIKKLGYYSYKKMTETLENSDWSSLELVYDGRAKGDYISVFRVLNESGAPVYIAWWDYFDDPEYAEGKFKYFNLESPELLNKSATITDLIPNVEQGSDVINYNSAFMVETLSSQNGSFDLYLNETPVVITFQSQTSHRRHRFRWFINKILEGHLGQD